MHTMLGDFDLFHYIKAALLALVATVFIAYQQTRYHFYHTREAFIKYQREQNKAKFSNANDKSKKGSKGKKKVTPVDFNEDDGTFVVGFFHPYCSSGGGGERVLWKSIQALGEMKEGNFVQRRSKIHKGKQPSAELSEMLRNPDGDVRLANCRNLAVVIYTVDEGTPEYDSEVLKKVKERFSIDIPPSLSINFVHLHEFKYLLDKASRFTMIIESFGTMNLAWCALSVITPHVFFDTTGCAFSYFVARVLAGCKVATYVHYPTISTDMLSLVWKRRPSYNNNAQITANPIVSCIKLIYYSMFAMCYGLVGWLADLTMVNSTWTKRHVEYLWKLSGRIHVVYPPVDTASLKKLQLKNRENMILSIGQMRPEKDHALQLQAFSKLLDDTNGETSMQDVKLVLIGSCRGEDDEMRVDQLRQLAGKLKIQDSVEFVLNEPYVVLKEYLGKASVGLHTMWNEHFGIGVVEMMAAGLVTVAHDSGGPKSDIILTPWDPEVPNDDATGCLASTADEYATVMREILKRGASSEVERIRENGRRSADRFSDEVFVEAFKETILTTRIFKPHPRLLFRWQK